MKRQHLLWGGALCAGLAMAAGAAGWQLARLTNTQAAAPAAPAAQARVQTMNGETVLTLPAEMLRAGGIEVTLLSAAATATPEASAYASVVDAQPLFELAQRLAAARAEREVAQAQAAASQAQYRRVQVLHQDDGNMSEKSLQEAGALAQADQARLRAGASAHTMLLAVLRQQFGDALAQAADLPASPTLRRLAAGQAALARVTWTDVRPTPCTDGVTLDDASGRRVGAHKLSPAPQADPLLQGVSCFYLLERALPAGMRALAHMPAPASAGGPGAAAAAVAIPANAVVWYGGQRWSYVRTAAGPDQRYTRRLVDGGGANSGAGLHAGDAVVTRGAQLLLSEEQRPQGIATQCKDPPECDD